MPESGVSLFLSLLPGYYFTGVWGEYCPRVLVLSYSCSNSICWVRLRMVSSSYLRVLLNSCSVLCNLACRCSMVSVCEEMTSWEWVIFSVNVFFSSCSLNTCSSEFLSCSSLVASRAWIFEWSNFVCSKVLAVKACCSVRSLMMASRWSMVFYRSTFPLDGADWGLFSSR